MFFCRHIWKLEKQEYNYTIYKILDGAPFNKTKRYIQYYRCVKCGKEKIKEIETPDHLTSEEINGHI